MENVVREGRGTPSVPYRSLTAGATGDPYPQVSQKMQV